MLSQDVIMRYNEHISSPQRSPISLFWPYDRLNPTYPTSKGLRLAVSIGICWAPNACSEVRLGFWNCHRYWDVACSIHSANGCKLQRLQRLSSGLFSSSFSPLPCPSGAFLHSRRFLSRCEKRKTLNDVKPRHPIPPWICQTAKLPVSLEFCNRKSSLTR